MHKYNLTKIALSLVSVVLHIHDCVIINLNGFAINDI